MVWAGICLGGHFGLHIFHEITLSTEKSRDQILELYVLFANDTEFLPMDCSVTTHQARLVNRYLGDQSKERMEWLHISSIEYI